MLITYYITGSHTRPVQLLKSSSKLQALANSSRRDADKAPVNIESSFSNGSSRLETAEHVHITPECALVEELQALFVSFKYWIQ